MRLNKQTCEEPCGLWPCTPDLVCRAVLGPIPASQKQPCTIHVTHRAKSLNTTVLKNQKIRDAQDLREKCFEGAV